MRCFMPPAPYCIIQTSLFRDSHAPLSVSSPNFSGDKAVPHKIMASEPAPPYAPPYGA